MEMLSDIVTHLKVVRPVSETRKAQRHLDFKRTGVDLQEIDFCLFFSPLKILPHLSLILRNQLFQGEK